jgi:MipA family protein
MPPNPQTATASSTTASRLPPLLTTMALLALPGTLLAQARPPQPLWEVGGVAFGVSQQAYPGADQQVQRALALPYVIYRGRYLRADSDTAGLRAVKTPRYELDIGVAGSFGSSSSRIEARRGMPGLGTLVEFGPRLKINLGGTPASGRWRVDLPLRGVFDLSDSVAHRGLSFEPRLNFERRSAAGWRYSVALGALFADQRLADTFYGVSTAQATVDRAAFDARAGLVAWRASTFVSTDLSRDLTLFGFVRVDTVAGAANRDSPLVRRTTGATAGIGLSYTWLRSTRPAVD